MHNSDKDRRHLIIGNYDLYMLLKDIKDNYPDYPIVVLAHHSPDYFDESEKQAVEHIFRDYPIELYLCGDAHIAWQRAINGCLEITMGCIKQEVGTEVAFLVGDTNLSDYTAHHWASGAWEPFTRVNEEIAQYYKTNSSTLNMMSNPRKLAEKIFKTIVGLGRFKGYDQTDDKPITDIKDTILSNSKERTLEEIVFGIGSQFKENTCEYSVSLYGKGGSGKTHQFISLIKEILFGLDENKQLKYPDTIPYYLELNDVSELKDINEIKQNVVLYELSKSMGIEQNRLERILERKGANVIIFADGMNEVTDDKLRRAIAQSICKIRERYKTRIVLSSREDHSGLFNSLGRGTNQIFVKAEICELTEKQINDYFERVGISFKYHEIPKATRRLLLTAQGLSMYAEMSLDDPEKTLEFSTLGSLLQSYCDKIMVIDRSSPVSDLNFEKMLSFIAYHMVLIGKFELKSNILEELLDSEQLKELKENNKVSLIFADHGKDDYEFSHQNFRDYYAGLYLAKHIKSINHNNVVSILDEFLGNNNATINDEILLMCSDFLDTSYIQDAIDCLKSINNNYRYSFQLSVLIRLYAFSNHNDISEMNLDSLDLRSVSLSNYKLYSKRGNSSICISLKESKISEDTFLQNGLQTASSTICRYTYKGEEYICAFSASNAQIYSIRNNTWRCVHNLPNNGWVNCCCVIEMHKQPCILLGCSKGTVSAFYPSDEKVDILFKIQEYSEIESIFCVKSSEKNNKIIFSDSNGNIFIRDQYENANLTLKKIFEFPPEIRKSVAQRFSNNGISPTSRLSISDNFIYFCYGSEIWRCKLPLENDPKFELFKKFNEDDLLIKDIMYTDEILFLNLCKKISLIPCDSANDDISVIPFELDANKKLDHFTKFSPANDKRMALVGVYAVKNDYSELDNFYRITVKYDNFDEEYIIVGEEIRGLQTLATYTGVFFQSPNNNIIRIATVSDDRSVQVISPSDEEADTILHRGSYDGIHAIDIVNDKELLIAQYDGSISYWYRSRSGLWLCRDVFHVHNNWVWKVRHFYKEEKLHFISCSYDGTLKEVNVETGKEKILIDTGKLQARSPILDFAVLLNDFGNLHEIIALTEQRILCWCADKESVITVNTMNLKENWKNYIFRSVAVSENKAYIAVKVTTTDEMDLCCVAELFNNDIKLNFMAEDTCSFIRCLKIFDFNEKKVMVIGGNYSNVQYFAFYVYDGNCWTYKGSCNPAVSTPFETICNATKEYDAEENDRKFFSFGAINDLITEPLPMENNESICFLLTVVCKDGNLVNYEVIINADNTIITPQKMINDVSSQPMCINSTDNQFLIGKLNGEASFIDKESFEDFSIRTYANLTASVSVKLKDADLGDASQKDEFQEHFKGYFDFKN